MRLIGLTAVAALAAAPATAQDGLAGLLLRFFSPTNPVVLAQNPNPALDHAAHFVSQAEAQTTLTQLNRGIASQLSTFPLGSSSAGFAYTFDSSLGVYNRTTESFGPTFAERPLTAGKGRFSVGVNHVRASYDRFEGRDLRGDGIRLNLVHEDVNNDGTLFDPWFEGDLIDSRLTMELTSETFVVFANYGVSDRFDVSIAVPFVSIELDARIHTTLQRVATAADPFIVHVFPDGSDERTFRESGEASGVGDIVLRGKYNFHRGASANVAAAADLRLPTGDENDLLGSGATQAKLYLVGAASTGRLLPRGSLGFTLSSGGGEFTGDLPHEFNYSAGFDLVAHPRVTASADLIGRTLFDTDRLVDETRSHRYRLRLDPTPREIPITVTAPRTGNLNLVLAAAGVKLNPVGRLLVSASVLFSIGEGGLQDRVTPVFGLDYTF
jgi:hypothetical protein